MSDEETRSDWRIPNCTIPSGWLHEPLPSAPGVALSHEPLPSVDTMPPLPCAPLTEERLHVIIAEVIRKVLYPDSEGVTTPEHRRVRQWDADGVEWRGVLYRVEKEPPV